MNNKYSELPKTIILDDVDYHLVERQLSKHDEIIPSWWQFWYERHDRVELPPRVSSGKEIYYLISSAEEKCEAYNDLLELVNNIDDEATNKIKKHI